MIVLLISLLNIAAYAGNILNENMIVTISDPGYDTLTGLVNGTLNIWAYDKLTGDNKHIGEVDLYKSDMKYKEGIYLFLTDWKRDRLIIAATRQVMLPNYFIIDLNEMSIKDLISDSLENNYGELFINPNCDYIILMGADDKSEKTQFEDPNILYIFTFDAETYSFISKISGISVFSNSIIPRYFIPHNSDYLYLKNPFQDSWSSDIIKLSLPDLKLVDTLRIPVYCGDSCIRVLTYNIEANKALIYVERNENGDKYSAYKVINTDTHQECGSLKVDSHFWGILSKDGEHVAIHDSSRSITVYDTTFLKIFEVDNVLKKSLFFGYFNDSTLIVGSKAEEGVRLKYDIIHGTLIERIPSEEHHSQ